jgi:putative flippase GtrA
MLKPLTSAWRRFEEKRPGIAQFAMFFLLSNGVTALQAALMPVFKAIFNQTALVDIAFQVWPVGANADGSQYYVFNYPAGPVDEFGVGGGLAYFLAMQITIAIAQVINFFAQRNITFKANNSVAKAAFWYVIAYILITIGAAVAQGFYKAPIYSWTMEVWPSGGEAVADVITMIINAAIAFWVFFPIFKVIFKNTPDETVAPATVSQTTPDTLNR